MNQQEDSTKIDRVKQVLTQLAEKNKDIQENGNEQTNQNSQINQNNKPQIQNGNQSLNQLKPSLSLNRKKSMDYLIPYIGLDIGGTVAKCCIAFKKGINVEFTHLAHLKIQTHSDFDLYFEDFPSNDLTELFEFIDEQEISNFTQKFYITGGGAHKYEEVIKKRLGVQVIKVQEMQSLSYGLKVLDMLLPNDSVYRFNQEKKQIEYIEQSNWMFPLILVQIGSGVSILKVKNKDEFERVSGTSLGGNVFLGIAHLLTGNNNFNQALKKASIGNNRNIDLFVSDIYKQIQSVPEDIYGDSLCVSFGRVKQMLKEGKEIKTEDLLQSALQMVAFNISQIAFLVARIHKIDHIFFTGYFIKNHTDTIGCIEEAVNYFSKSQEQNKKAFFLKHDGFLGALGSFYVAATDSKIKFKSKQEEQ
ncbi:hypothetical protein PPERSA_11797 [Pseudocohnilembus persalinus]|uniref:Pantothenate kinase n=1 Tax=Pseudocohnilembus persalinus TaxID=266149 RepID=A0A0V0QS24_PSEPJ|nr:hypothetical protein PPERSA_11797 [Pseudocohnilembus persalinus]|eukprot:KRX04741.1 hypothetical protein PPERSA_11797 [Pseudocohnilembus persalinus]